MNPKVSVILPVFNVEPYLCRCIDSIINQTLKDIEIIIVVEKQCTDSCVSICDAYAKKDSRINLIVNEKKGGLAHGRNVGLPYVRGEYIAFVDSDDYIKPNMMEVLYHKATKTNADAVYCNFFRRIGDVEKPYDENKEDYLIEGEHALSELSKDFVSAAPGEPHDIKRTISVWHCLFNSALIKNNDIRFYDEVNIPSEDYSFQLDILRHSNKVLFIKDILYVYCYNQDSLSQTFNLTMFERYSIVYNLVKERLKLVDKDDFRVNRLYIGTCRSNMFHVVNLNTSRMQKMNYLEAICNSDIWEQVRTYPIEKLPLYQRAILKCTLSKNYFALYIILYIYSSLKKISKRL